MATSRRFSRPRWLSPRQAPKHSGDLAGVTMRVLDDVSDIDAVILELDANRGEDEEGAERDAGDDRPIATPPSPPTRMPKRTASTSARDDELHEPDDDERGEGRLEDRRRRAPGARAYALTPPAWRSRATRSP